VKLKSWRHRSKPAFLTVLLALTAAAQDSADATALLSRGIALVATNPAEAVRVLRRAVQLEPGLPGLRHQLGLAYHATGDEADAEPELREAVRAEPGNAATHNDLGIVLFRMGNINAARGEFQAAASLAPKDPNAHFNLGEALARSGDSAAALAELREATGLAPTDAGLARLLERVETAVSTESTIKVEVRQVLVPVVVTGHDGHRISGLTQTDFKIFEDGVEQKIASFSAESFGEAGTALVTAASAVKTSAPAHSPTPAIKPRRTYMIVLDLMHNTFASLTAAREALLRLFQEEQPGDSQYAVIALGAAPEVVVNITSDPAAVRAALSNKRFQKLAADANTGSLTPEIERFRRDLVDTRNACDLAPADGVFKIKCSTGIGRTADRARQIAEVERALNAGFLGQFRSLVAQLAAARDRRTIILVSDGFTLEPGREALSLFNAYFPPASHCLLPPDLQCPPDMMQSLNRMSNEFEAVLKLASGANIVIDTIDARGLTGAKGFDAATGGASPSVDGEVDRAARDLVAARGNTLSEIAEATGGTASHNANNLLAGLERAFADARTYYTLAYVSTNPAVDGRFRAITVQASRPGAMVNAKRGYWAAQ
jgi:VWFA-related protein